MTVMRLESYFWVWPVQDALKGLSSRARPLLVRRYSSSAATAITCITIAALARPSVEQREEAADRFGASCGSNGGGIFGKGEPLRPTGDVQAGLLGYMVPVAVDTADTTRFQCVCDDSACMGPKFLVPTP